jgi:nucleoside-diphosphate-sugar epimerase
MRLQDKRIVVTGGGGFLGSHVVAELQRAGCRDVFVPRSRDYDLRRGDDVVRLLDERQPEVVVHLAAVVGGVGVNRENPGRFFYENLMMGVQLMEEARLRNVPDGQPRRCLDVSKAKQEFDFSATTELRDGLERTIAWYRGSSRVRRAG